MHATEADIVLYLEDKLSVGEAERMKRHFSECHDCREQLVVILRLPSVIESAEAPPLDGRILAEAEKLIASSTRPALLSFSDSMAGRFAIAAMVLLAVGVSYYALRERSLPSRFRDRAAVLPTLLVVPPDGAMLKQTRPTLSWSTMKNSVGYRITLYRENGTALWEGASNDSTILVPPEVALQTGKTYLWRVESFFPDRSIYESKLNAFVYSP